MADLTVVTDATFEAEVLKSELPVLVDFWAVWCGPCRAVAPAVEELAKEYQGKLKVCKVDVDNNRAAAQALGINSIPTLYLFKGGIAVDKVIGAVPKSMLKQMVEKNL